MTKQQKKWVKDFLETPEGKQYIIEIMSPEVKKAVDRQIKILVNPQKIVKELEHNDPADWWRTGKNNPCYIR